METKDPLRDLIAASDTSHEVDALGSLEKQLVPNKGSLSIEDLEQEWLEFASSSLGDDSAANNPFPEKNPEKILANIDDLKRFTCYLFERRYGWSEALCEDNKVDYSSRRRLGSTPSCPTSEEDVKLKARLNDLLDDFLKWYLCQPLSKPLLESIKYTIHEANSLPVVRNQTFVHVMEWLKVNSHDCVRISESFHLIKDIIVSGLTDIWSAIRNACVGRLSPIIEQFKITQIEAFFKDLVQICLSKESSWQAIEGASMGINSVIRRFQWIGCQPVEPSLCGSEKAEYYLKFGHEELKQLPLFISSQIHSVIFPLLGHPQLSIRENAIKSFSSFLSRCEFKEALLSFKEVISLLCKGAIPDPLPSDVQTTLPSTPNHLPHLAVLNPDYKFLDAYHAEGLLGVCTFLVKHINPGYLLPHWPLYFSTFNLYLMHPASTVRQATSGVFKYLVAKDSNNPSLLKLVLQGLCAEWSVDMPLLTQHVNYRAIHKSQISTEPQNPGFEHDEKCFPVTRQRVSSTDSYEKAFDGEMLTSRHSVHHSKHRRLSIGMIHSTGSGDQSYTTPDSLISKAWEWREGRLFAYELIIKFLIINHIHYLFPSYALPPHKFDGMASTDDTVTASRQNRMLDSKSQERSQSHGGTSLHRAFHAHVLVKKNSLDETRNQGDDKERSSSAGKERTPNSPISQSNNPKVLTRASSERRKDTQTYIPEELQTKRAMTLMEVGPQTHNPIKKHYSYFAKQEKQKISPRLKFLATATSLLNQTKRMDESHALKTSEAGDVSCLHSPVRNQKTPDDMTSDIELLKSCLYPACREASLVDVIVPEWINSVQCESMAGILQSLLFETIECLADTRWELRRMGQQTLPLITECIRWYDMQILKVLWNKYLVNETTLMCYGACIALKFSINHAVRLVHFLEQPPASWKDPGACRDIALSIVDVIRDGLPKWMRIVHQIIHRPNFDKLTVVAMEIVMLAHSCFPHCTSEKSFEEMTVVNLFQKLFVHAHRHHSLAEELKSGVDIQPLQTPLEGFLNCCVRDEIRTGYPELMEKYAVTECHPWMPHFLRSCDIERAISVLPIVVYHVGYYSEISDMYRALLEAIHCILHMTSEYLHKECQVKPTGEMAKSYNLAMVEMCNLITLKNLELSVVRQLLDLFVMMCSYVDGTGHLCRIFEVITARLDLFFALGGDPSPVRTDSEAYGVNSSNLVLMSNDIPTSPVEAAEDVSDDEDKEHDQVIQESLVLNTSNSSSQTPGRRSATPEGRVISPAIGDSESESGSDWDSWEDEEEDQTALTGIFAEFLHKLQIIYSYVPQGGKHSAFHDELVKSGESERKLINSLLDKA